MPKEVIFPKVDMDMESGLLSEWLCANGETVTEGQSIFIIETDKSAMEIESVASGRIAIREATTGDHYPVGKVMAYIYESHEAYDEAAESQSDGNAVDAQSTNDETINAQQEADTAASNNAQSRKPETGNSAVQPMECGNVRASPAARRLAAANEIPLAKVSGSARSGRVNKADVLAYIAGVGKPAQAVVCADVPETRGVATHQQSGIVGGNESQSAGVRRIPHTGMRRTIASRLTQATQDIPSYQIVVDCQCQSVLRTADELNQGIAKGLVAAGEQGKVSLNVFFIKALGLALRDFPIANSQWTDTERLTFDTVDIGLAVALDDGLITPIVKSVESKSVMQIASDTEILIKRAREGSLAKAEYQGGVSTVSNLGMFGVREFTSIINPPQASIISVGAVEKCATVVGNEIKIRPLCRVTFTFDHRLIDGAVGAQLASRFKAYLESSVQLLL